MQIAKERCAVHPADNQRPADDQRQAKAGDRHPQANDHEYAAQHFSQMQAPVSGLRQRFGNTRMHEWLEAGKKGHAADSEA